MKKLLIGSTLVIMATLTYAQIKPDIEADREAIIELNKQWDENALAGNMEANAEQYAEEAVRIGYGTVIVGKKAIRKTFIKYDKQLKATENENLIEDISITGDMAVTRGIFSGSFVSLDGGETNNEKGTWVDVYQRQPDGSWKSLCTIFSEIKE